MSETDDIEFLELVARSTAGKATKEEIEKIRRVISKNPELREKSDTAIVLHEALTLEAAAEAPAIQVPKEAESKIRSIVEKTIGPRQSSWWKRNRMILAAAAVFIILAFPVAHIWWPDSNGFEVRVAVAQNVDLPTSSGEVSFFGFTGSKDVPKEAVENLEFIRSVFPGAKIDTMTNNEIKEWEGKWPRTDRKPVIKIIFEEGTRLTRWWEDHIRVEGRWRGASFQKDFPVAKLGGYNEALQLARSYIVEELEKLEISP